MKNNKMKIHTDARSLALVKLEIPVYDTHLFTIKHSSAMCFKKKKSIALLYIIVNSCDPIIQQIRTVHRSYESYCKVIIYIRILYTFFNQKTNELESTKLFNTLQKVNLQTQKKLVKSIKP